MDLEEWNIKYGPKLDELGFYTDGKIKQDEKGNFYIEYKNFKKDSPFLYALLVVKENKESNKISADIQIKVSTYRNLSLRKLLYVLKHGFTEKDDKYMEYNWD